VDDGDVLDGLEKEVLFVGILDVGVDQEGVGFSMDVFHSDLETVEASGFGDLDFSAELFSEVFKNNTVTGSKEGQNVLDKVLFVLVESFPVLQVGKEIDFFGSPERSHLLLVHLPDLGVLNGEKNETIRVFFEDGFNFSISLGSGLGILLQERSETELVGLDVIEVSGDKDFGLGVGGAVLRKGFHFI